MNKLRMLVLSLTLIGASSALAVQPDEILKDPALEQRARALSRDLRCMVCQNQSIDDSDAPLARDLRLLVRERLKAGDSDTQVVDFLTARYGDFVLLKPRFGPETVLLWALPALVLLGGALGLAMFLRRQRGVFGGTDAAESPKSLTPDEQKRLSALLKTGNNGVSD
jgi:cytochrome c-type biogenesis protein CcmH